MDQADIKICIVRQEIVDEVEQIFGVDFFIGLKKLADIAQHNGHGSSLGFFKGSRVDVERREPP